MDFSQTLFRCFSLGNLMTEPRSLEDRKAGQLSDTCKRQLVQFYKDVKYGRPQNIKSKYITKGLGVEEDSLTLYSRVKKIFFKKNTERLTNWHLTGLPDTYIGEAIRKAERVIDVKSSWDLETFLIVMTKPLDNLYYWQGQAYMYLTGAPTYTVAYCLVNTPDVLIMDEKRKLLWEMGGGTEENPDYIEACEKIDRAMRFDDIPMEERVIEFCFNRNDDDILAIGKRVVQCREWLQAFDAVRANTVIMVPDKAPTIIQPVQDIWGAPAQPIGQLEMFGHFPGNPLPLNPVMDPAAAMAEILDKIDSYISQRLIKLS